MARKKSNSDPPRFEPGTKVRARHGVRDPDFPDIPLNGWAGTVKEVERTQGEPTYLIAWDRATLEGMPPVYKKRCERDGLELEAMWLGDDDLEPDDGTLVPIEQPTKVVTQPLSRKERDDRVRLALGLTHDDPLPEISAETLLTYHRYLKDHLKFPFDAYCEDEEIGPFSRRRATMSVTGLLDPVRGLDVQDGLLCTGRVQGDEIEFPLAVIELRSKKKDPNVRLISDYAYWFHNWPCRDEGDFDPDDDDEWIEPEIPPPSRRALIKLALVLGVWGCLLGATIGTALKTLSGAGPAAMIGGILLGTIVALLLGRHGMAAGAVGRFPYEAVLGTAFGLVGGGVVGAVAGLAVVALPWSLLGLLAGMFLGPYVLPKRPRRRVSFRVASFGTCVGILVSAFRHDQARATAGAVSGAITGLAVAIGLVLLLVGAVYLTPRSAMGYDEEADDLETAEEEDEDHGGLHLRRI